jgi:YesN/AraC family two-component response regulator
MNRLYFSSLLRKHCEGSRLYLNHDLTLTQLAEAIGTNRTYLSAYFAQKGITFNIYINRLRIQHFERLYNKAVANYQPISAKQLSCTCGFRSYVTFSEAFKAIKGQNYSEWRKRCLVGPDDSISFARHHL